MDRDIGTLRGAIRYYLEIMDLEIKTDETFYKKLLEVEEDNITTKEYKDKLDSINRAILKDLRQAYQLTIDYENELLTPKGNKYKIQILNNIQTFKKLLFGYLKRKINFQQTPKTTILGQYLTRAIASSRAADDLKNAALRDTKKITIQIIKERILQLQNLEIDNRMKNIDLLLNQMNTNSRKYFKMKAKNITFFRSKIDTTVSINNKYAVNIRIYFEEAVSPRYLLERIEHRVNIIENILSSENPDNKILNVFRRRLEDKKKLFLNGIKDTEAEILQGLRDCIVQILETNERILLAPRTKIDVRITASGIFALAANVSLPNHYIIHFSIDALLLMFIICKDFQETLPIETITYFFNATLHRTKVSEVLNKKNPEEPDFERMLSSELKQIRVLSVYNVLFHEMQHVYDDYRQESLNDLIELYGYVVYEAKLTKSTDNVGLDSDILEIMKFLHHIKNEAITQLQEFIVQIKSDEENKTAYHIINPLKFKSYNKAVKIMNDMINNVVSNTNSAGSQKKYYYLETYKYSFAQIITFTIFFADCFRMQTEMIIMDAECLLQFLKIFPGTEKVLTGYSHIDSENILLGTKQYAIIQEMRNGNIPRVKQMLEEHNIKYYGVNELGRLFNEDKEFFIFKPSIIAVQKTVDKLNISDIISFYKFYNTACDILKVKERLLSWKDFNRALELHSKAHDKLLKDAGYLP